MSYLILIGIVASTVTIISGIFVVVHFILTHHDPNEIKKILGITAGIATFIVVGTVIIPPILPHPRPQIPPPPKNRLTPSGTYQINDPLSRQNANQWDDRLFPDGFCQFRGGTYHASANQPGHRNYCTENATYFTNFYYQVQMQVIQGDCGGLIFRKDSANANYYSFEICMDGTYNISVYSRDIPKYLIPPMPSSAIPTGVQQKITIAVAANGNTITIYVNGQQIGSVINSTYTDGQIGIEAQAQSHPTEVAFSNAEVRLF